MTHRTKPRLSIGLPVFNGEQFLAHAIESILGQTYSDFELVIADNASTDGTLSICHHYAGRDSRVRVHRNQTNIGATQNWYLVHKLSSGEYFASAAHDDIYDPDYMRACIEVLDADPSVTVCHSKTTIIDEHGNRGGQLDIEVNTMSARAHERLHQLLTVDYMCIQLYGVMRSEDLRRTRVFEGYFGCDRNTLAELCLLGKIAEVPRYLFHHRLYAGSLGMIVQSGKSTAEIAAIDPGTVWNRPLVNGLIWRNYFASVARLVQAQSERIRCYELLSRLMFAWIRRRVAARMGALLPGAR